jgi:hypothetical protein
MTITARDPMCRSSQITLRMPWCRRYAKACAGCSSSELAAVQHVVRDQVVDEVHDRLPELRRLSFELGQGFRKAVRDLDVLAAQLAQELHLVIAGDAERGAGLDQLHDDPEDARDVWTSIDKVAEEDELATIRMPGCVDVVAQRPEQGLELGAASMDVADDVEGPRSPCQLFQSGCRSRLARSTSSSDDSTKTCPREPNRRPPPSPEPAGGPTATPASARMRGAVAVSSASDRFGSCRRPSR